MCAFYFRLQILMPCHNKLVEPFLTSKQTLGGDLLQKRFHQKSIYVRPDNVILSEEKESISNAEDFKKCTVFSKVLGTLVTSKMFFFLSKNKPIIKIFCCVAYTKFQFIFPNISFDITCNNSMSFFYAKAVEILRLVTAFKKKKDLFNRNELLLYI